MSKKTNPTLIGAFVLGALAIAVFAIYFFASQTLFVKKEKYVLYFPQSINGLDIGASVKFMGVEIGRVSQILLSFQGELAYVPVVIEIPKRKLFRGQTMGLKLGSKNDYLAAMKKGLRGSLGLQSILTGKCFIELDYFPDEPALFVGTNPPYREIPTIKSNYEKIWIGIKDTFERIRKVDFKTINDKLLSALDAVELASSKVGKQIDPLASDLKDTLARAGESFDELKKAASSVDNLISPDSPYGGQLNVTLEDISKAAQSIHSLAEFLERNPNAILAGRKLPD